ncbi:hypothetical protein Fcan01_04036 [Folsomia candida]|uniref:Uncharacterized protein n=1 Tax=Folsomia candida TaxID=158441 RepID=A0A226ETK4_FOLCA|nr:hypothetical protein Fcan01_04036 [Folsomia candida]
MGHAISSPNKDLRPHGQRDSDAPAADGGANEVMEVNDPTKVCTEDFETFHVMEEANPLATNYLVATCLLSHFGNPEVMTFRLVCSTWASAGGVILSRRDGGNARAYLRLEEEGDALRRIDRLDALLARTSSPRYLLPSAIAVSTSCIRSKSADPGATPRVQAFLKQNGEYVKGVEFFRSERRENDAEMFDEVKMILETCQNLTDLAFLPYKAKIGQTQEVAAFSQSLQWTPIRPAAALAVNLRPLKLTTLVVQMCHPRHLAAVIVSSPNLRELSFLAPHEDTRTPAELLEDWEGFQEAVNEFGGGVNQIKSLSLEDWDLVPNVEMKNLKSVKLSMLQGVSTVPESQKISYSIIYPQVTSIHLYLCQERLTLLGNRPIHRFLNRFPDITTLLLEFRPDLRLHGGWDEDEEFVRVLANRNLFNPVECAVNYNVTNLVVYNTKAFQLEEEPVDIFEQSKPFSNLTKLCPDVENLAIYRIRHLTLDLHPPAKNSNQWNDWYDRWNDKVLFPAVIVVGTRLQSFKLSGFGKFTQTSPDDLEINETSHDFFEREAPALGNVSLAKFDFRNRYPTGAFEKLHLQRVAYQFECIFDAESKAINGFDLRGPRDLPVTVAAKYGLSVMSHINSNVFLTLNPKPLMVLTSEAPVTFP